MTMLKGWRTRIVSAALFIVGVAGFCQGIDIRAFLSDIGLSSHQTEIVMIGSAIIMGIMREITTTASGQKEPSA